jgi:plastocyanin
MNKLLIGLVVIALGVAAGWYYMKGSIPGMPATPTPQPTQEVTQGAAPEGAGASGTEGSAAPVATQTVTHTDSGFFPASITVKKGTTVTFMNSALTNMWVASDVHPTHQLLPGFDELKVGANGAQYQYTFVKVGTWTYHNHVKPTEKGTVIVTE